MFCVVLRLAFCLLWSRLWEISPLCLGFNSDRICLIVRAMELGFGRRVVAGRIFKRVVIYLASAVLIFFGLVFVVSVNLGFSYLLVGVVLFAVAVFLLFLGQEKKPMEIKQTVTVTQPLEAKGIRCPNCGAMIDPTKAEVLSGKLFVTCDHCGNKFELTEEPTW
jgi:hypothetical protein